MAIWDYLGLWGLFRGILPFYRDIWGLYRVTYGLYRLIYGDIGLYRVRWVI